MIEEQRTNRAVENTIMTLFVFAPDTEHTHDAVVEAVKRITGSSDRKPSTILYVLASGGWLRKIRPGTFVLTAEGQRAWDKGPAYVHGHGFNEMRNRR